MPSDWIEWTAGGAPRKPCAAMRWADEGDPSGASRSNRAGGPRESSSERALAGVAASNLRASLTERGDEGPAPSPFASHETAKKKSATDSGQKEEELRASALRLVHARSLDPSIDRYRCRGLLLRPTQSLAARHRRKHQPPPTPGSEDFFEPLPFGFRRRKGPVHRSTAPVMRGVGWPIQVVLARVMRSSG
jgi:hypothetical protein